MLVPRKGRWTKSLHDAANAILEDEDHRMAFKASLADVVEHAMSSDEDLLTAGVFERLQYLPPAMAWSILFSRVSSPGKSGARPASESHVAHFWPNYPDPSTANLVEPDVVWESRDVVLGIEIKWHDKQTVQQLRKQYRAIAARFRNKQVWQLALGGLTPTVLAELAESPEFDTLLTLTWPDVLREIEVRIASGCTEEAAAVLRDIRDLIHLRLPPPREHLFLDTLPMTAVLSTLAGVESLPRPASPAAKFFCTLPGGLALSPHLALEPVR